MIKKGELYYPTENFKKRAWLKSKAVYNEAAKDSVKFWEKKARELFWFKSKNYKYDDKFIEFCD